MVKEADKTDVLAGECLGGPGDKAWDEEFDNIFDGPFKSDRRAASRIIHGAQAVVYDQQWQRTNLRRDIQKEIKELLLMGQIPIISPVDRITVDLLARNLAHLREIDSYLAKEGVLNSQGDPRNALKYYGQFMNAAIKLCDQLCITPKTRIQLGLNAAPTSPDLAAEIRNAKGGNGK